MKYLFLLEDFPNIINFILPRMYSISHFVPMGGIGWWNSIISPHRDDIDPMISMKYFALLPTNKTHVLLSPHPVLSPKVPVLQIRAHAEIRRTENSHLYRCSEKGNRSIFSGNPLLFPLIRGTRMKPP